MLKSRLIFVLLLPNNVNNYNFLSSAYIVEYRNGNVFMNCYLSLFIFLTIWISLVSQFMQYNNKWTYESISWFTYMIVFVLIPRWLVHQNNMLFFINSSKTCNYDYYNQWELLLWTTNCSKQANILPLT